MAERFFPFDSGAGSSVGEADWSKMARLWRGDGVIVGDTNELAVSANGSGMQVFVDTGVAWQLGFFYENTASLTVGLDAASANDRIDRIVVRLDTTANTFLVHVIKGTPGVSPSAPALAAGPIQFDLPLARVFVDSAAVNVDSPDLTDDRLLSSASGGVIGGYAPPVTADQPGGIIGETDLTGLSRTCRIGAGRLVKITAQVALSSTAANDDTVLRIKEGIDVIQAAFGSTDQIGSFLTVQAIVPLMPSAGVHTYKLSLERSTGTGTLTMRANANYPAFLLVEDVGAA